jgi:nucleoside-diphosphate-sugar epimerase
VLGASGFIGRWVARILCGQGADVSLVVRRENNAKRIFKKYEIEGQIYEADLRDEAQLWAVIEAAKPTITFNLAGYGVARSERSDEKTAYALNVDLVKNLCHAVAEFRDTNWTGQDLVHVGTALEYGVIDGDLSETSVPQPTELYGESKLAGTQVLEICSREYGLKALTARLFTVYGPGEQDGRLLPSLWEIAHTPRTMQLTDGKQRRDFIYVEEAAESLLRLGLIENRSVYIVNVATGRLTSVRDFIKTVAKIWGIPNDCLQFGVLPTRAEEMEHAPVNNEQLKHLTNWVPQITIETGIQMTGSFLDQLEGR